MKKVFEYSECIGMGRLTVEQCETWMKRDQARLEPHELAVRKTLRQYTMPDSWFPSECFMRAIQYLRLNPQVPEALYVFGESASGGLGQHGWVEIGDIVFDGVQQAFYDKAGYYKADAVKVWYRFTRKATLYIDMMSKRHCGWSYRWDHVLRLPWADFDNPLLIDIDEARKRWRHKKLLQPAFHRPPHLKIRGQGP